MQTCLRLILFALLLTAAALRAASPLENAFHAQSLLGPGVWSKVIRVRNDARGGPYPRIVHALVFELGGRLWFYTDVNGTQSFSLHRGELEREKADFAPLLRDIEPGFGRWSELTAPADATSGWTGKLPNGCFIESLAALRDRVARGARAEEPRLLSYYRDTADGRKGHTVLAYDAGEGIEVFDPDRPRDRFVFAASSAQDALALARALDGTAIAAARYFPLRSTVATEWVASAARARSRMSAGSPDAERPARVDRASSKSAG